MKEERHFYIPYDEIEVDYSAELEETFTEELVNAFSAVIGDTDSFHVSDESAAMTVFQNKIVHGVHLLAYVSVLIGKKLPGFGTIYCSHEFEFLKPVYIGDTVVVKVTVLEKMTHHRLRLRTTIENKTRQESVFDGIAVIKTYR